MLKELLKNKELYKIIDRYLEKSEVIDILLFGSTARGKDSPGDIDFLIIFSDQVEDYLIISNNLRKELDKIYKNIEVIALKYRDLFSSTFLAREAVLSESYSFRNKEYLSRSFGYKNFTLFKYSLKNLNKSKRMQFYYSLYGRGKQKGVLENNQAIKFSKEIILALVENSEIFKKFFESWKLEYTEFPILIPERVIKYSLLKKL
jgi:predicted nucleotidyltransferase